MKYLFIGERRSDLAIKMKVTWKDKRLASKQLFDALDKLGIKEKQCVFLNWFEPLRQQGYIFTRKYFMQLAQEQNYKIVAMGRRVERELNKKKIPHTFIFHPAARGVIRGKENYFNHIKQKLHNGK